MRARSSSRLGAVVAVMLATGIATVSAPAFRASAAGGTRQIPSGGTTTFRAAPDGAEGLQAVELNPNRTDAGSPPAVNRPLPDPNPFPPAPLSPPRVASSRVTTNNPDVAVSVQGLNVRNQRLANGGNQFSVEPPDQGLCVGNGFTVEAVNSVLRVYRNDGSAATGVEDLNTFFGYDPAILRSAKPPLFGPDVIDPICHFDPENQRFIVSITTLFHANHTADFNGKNTIDIAVSNTSDPTGAWTIYHTPAQNDGTDGTPNHGCTTDGTTPGPCFQDYPHIGGDRNGIYITTNEYDLFGPNYNAAQIFAFSKQQLAAHPASIDVTLIENLHVAGTPGWTVWPATSPAGEYSNDANGSEFLLSTITGDGSETGNPFGSARKIGLWAITNTASLNGSTPSLGINSRLIDSEKYVNPPRSNQKVGSTPLRDCINDTTRVTPFGTGCWNYLFTAEPAHDEVESSPDSGDSRMQQTWYVNGMLWGSTSTAVNVGGQVKAGIAWFAVAPQVSGDTGNELEGEVHEQGYVAVAGNNLTYPALAMTTSGRGVIAFSLMGDSYYPSAGYVSINHDGEVGPVHVIAAGAGPDDGFTGYKAFVGDPPRTRWGDYGAAVTDGNSIWIASEYVAQTCTLDQYLATPLGSCGGTRIAFANWSTRISRVDVGGGAGD